MWEEKIYCVYILTSGKNATLYIGITSDLQARVSQHKEGKGKGFTQKYKVNQLVYYEEFGNVDEAIQREKQLKVWKREWKINLIEKDNPSWEDLYPKLFEDL